MLSKLSKRLVFKGISRRLSPYPSLCHNKNGDGDKVATATQDRFVSFLATDAQNAEDCADTENRLEEC